MFVIVGSIVFASGILGLFFLDRDQKARTSKALWIPVIWFLIIGSRAVSVWLHAAHPVESPDQAIDGSPLDGAIFAALIILGLIVLANRGQRVGTLLRRNGPILLYYLYAAASILWSDYPFVASKRWVKFVGDFVMVLIVLTDTDPPAALKRLLVRSGFLLVPCSVLLILARKGQAYNWTTGAMIWSGVTTDKNALGMDCMIFGLASLWYFLQEFLARGDRRRGGPLIAHGTILALVLWLFAKANSATALSCFLMAGALMVITRTTRLARRPVVLHLLVAAILSVSLAAVFLNAGGLVSALGRDPTLTGRTLLWKTLLSIPVNPLLGAGYESFWTGDRLRTLWSIYWWRPNEAHNGYLEVFLELGWLGLALLAVVLVTGYRRAVDTFRGDRQAGGLKLAFFVAVVAYNFTEAAFKMTNPVWIALLLAISGVAAPVRDRVNLPYRARSRQDRYLIGRSLATSRTQ